MFYKQIYLFTSIIILFTFSIGDEYRFPISTNSNHLVKLKNNHWSHADANSAIDIEGIEIDIFQWGIITKETKSIIVQLINPIGIRTIKVRYMMHYLKINQSYTY